MVRHRLADRAEGGGGRAIDDHIGAPRHLRDADDRDIPAGRGEIGACLVRIARRDAIEDERILLLDEMTRDDAPDRAQPGDAYFHAISLGSKLNQDDVVIARRSPPARSAAQSRS